MTLFIEKSKELTKKILRQINEFSKITRYKISVQKSNIFLYTYNELSENIIKKTVPFIIASRRTEYLVNLTKEVQHLYTKVYKTHYNKLMKTQINGNISHVHGLEKLILLK